MQGDVGELALVEGSPPAIVRNSEENLPGDRGTQRSTRILFLGLSSLGHILIWVRRGPVLPCLYFETLLVLCDFALGVGSCWPIPTSCGSVRWSAAAVLLAFVMKRVVDIMFGMSSTAQRNESRSTGSWCGMLLLPYLRMGM